MEEDASRKTDSVALKPNSSYPICVLCAPGDTGCYMLTLTDAVEMKIWSPAMLRMVASSVAAQLEDQAMLGYQKIIPNSKVNDNVDTMDDVDEVELEAITSRVYGMGPRKTVKLEPNADSDEVEAVKKEKKKLPEGMSYVKPKSNVTSMNGKRINPQEVARKIVTAMEDPKLGEGYYVTPFQQLAWSDRFNNAIMSLKSMSDTLEAGASPELKKTRDEFMKINFPDNPNYAEWSGRYYWLVKSVGKVEYLFMVMLSYAAGLFAGQPVRENSLEENGTLVSNVLPHSWGRIWKKFVDQVNPKTLSNGDWDSLDASYQGGQIMGKTINQVWDSNQFQFLVVDEG